jgi:hypothetical protein
MDELNTFIDTVQSTKKAVVKSIVTNNTIAESLNGFIDAQTTYTKEAAKATVSAIGVITSELAKINEQLWNGKSFKAMQTKMSDDLYSSFWKEAFKHYNPTYK